MKKIVIASLFTVSLILTSCGGGTETTEVPANDTTDVVKADTTKTVCVDSTKVDSTTAVK